MKRRRSRSRSRSSGGRGKRQIAGGIILIALIVFIIFNISGVGAFTTEAADRLSNIGAVSDANALVGLDVAPSVNGGTQTRLVSVTNRHAIATDITVSLNDGNQGDLYYNGTNRGDSYTVESVAPGETVQFDIKGSTGGDWTSSDCSKPEASGKTSSGDNTDDDDGGPPGNDDDGDDDDNDGWKVTFYCAKYDSTANETTYKYNATPMGDPDELKDLSHIVFGFSDLWLNPTIVASSPDSESKVKTDPPTGVYGLKFDNQISKHGPGQTYTFTLAGNHGTADDKTGLKLGPNSPEVAVPGPAKPSGNSGGGSETLTFTVESTTDSTDFHVILERSTTLNK